MILDPHGHHFGYQFGAFFGITSHSFLKQFLHRFFDAVLNPFGIHFGVILDTFWCPYFVIKSVTFQRTSPGVPGPPRRLKKLDFHGRVV